MMVHKKRQVSIEDPVDEVLPVKEYMAKFGDWRTNGSPMAELETIFILSKAIGLFGAAGHGGMGHVKTLSSSAPRHFLTFRFISPVCRLG